MRAVVLMEQLIRPTATAPRFEALDYRKLRTESGAHRQSHALLEDTFRESPVRLDHLLCEMTPRKRPSLRYGCEQAQDRK